MIYMLTTSKEKLQYIMSRLDAIIKYRHQLNKLKTKIMIINRTETNNLKLETSENMKIFKWFPSPCLGVNKEG